MQALQKSYRLILILSLFSCRAYSQHFTETDFTGHVSGLKIQTDSVFLITTNYPATGIALHFNAEDSPEGSYIVVRVDTLYFHTDRENVNDEPVSYSNLYTFPVPVDSFRFCAGKIKHPVSFIFINAQLPEEKEPLPAKKKSGDCAEPEMIDQSVWREGLADPDYERISNVVHNVIIHHSAGSNTDTNYIQVVRSIYIYHTEVRGWSDIGYNYLIAQNGIVFKGRDPGALEQDNVLGAHFCASNTGTMGVCVLGNYMEIALPGETQLSLVDLITWKLGKDSLDPLGTYPHPLNSGLDVIAGHRDGCATDCPGDSLYLTFGNLRQLVMTKFISCGFEIKPLAIQNDPTVEFNFSLAENVLQISSVTSPLKQIALFDLSGRIILSVPAGNSYEEISILLPDLKAGMYLLSIDDGSSFHTYKMVIR